MAVNRGRLILTGIITAGLIIRIIGIRYGLPNVYHRDELIMIHTALGFGTKDWNPYFFEWPPLASYLLFSLYALYYGYLKIAGSVANPSQFLEIYLRDPSSFLLMGRFLLGVVFGTLSIPFIYLLGKKIFSGTVGLLSAFLLAFSALHVRDSHYAYNDMLLMLMIMIFYLFLFHFSESKKTVHFWGASLFLGLAIGTKYNAGLLLVPALMALILLYGLDSRPAIKKILLFCSIAFLTYAAINPFSIIAVKEFMQSFLGQVHNQHTVGPLHHLKYSLYQGVGPGVLLLTIPGIPAFFKAPFYREKIIFLIGTLTWYCVNAFFSQQYMRYAIPYLPLVYIGAAAGLHYLISLRNKPLKSLLLSLFSILFILQVYKTIRIDYLFEQRDNRDVAREWIEKHLPQNAVVALSDWGPPLTPSEKQIRKKMADVSNQEVLNRIRPKDQTEMYKNKKLMILLKKTQAASKTFDLYLLYEKREKPLLSKPELIPYSWSALKKQSIEFLVLRTSFPEEAPSSFWWDLKRKARLLTVISPYGNGKPFDRYDRYEDTGGSLDDREVIHRVRYGDLISVYQIVSY